MRELSSLTSPRPSPRERERDQAAAECRQRGQCHERQSRKDHQCGQRCHQRARHVGGKKAATREPGAPL